MSKCSGTIRSPKGNRLLIVLSTDPDGDEAKAFRAQVRATNAGNFATMPDVELTEYLIDMIAKVPATCPECDAGREH